MAADFKLQLTTGLIGGMTVQFADGAWPGKVGNGLAMTDEAFDVVEPLIQHTVPGWTSMHRYGVFELESLARSALAKTFRSKAAEYRRTDRELQPRAEMLEELAAWLEARSDQMGPVSVFGY